MNQRSLLFAGLPHTGKSSFLALLNVALTDGRNTTLAADSFRDDRGYLNRLTSDLVQGEPAGRTMVGQADGLNLSLKDPAGSRIFLKIPDLSGETWADLLADRVASDAFIQAIHSTQGYCIFVHASDFTVDPTITASNVAQRALGEEATESTESIIRNYSRGPRSSQIDLVDLLQILGEQFGDSRKKISVIVSAYDEAGDFTPTEWLRMNAPLADQYLRANSGKMSVRIFGLSAQGGRFDMSAAHESLREQEATERAFMLDESGNRVVFDEPLVWAIDFA